ncbi:MAG TPA: PTS sugar transporter subunit IIA [Candidatus Didemnitutus sp.]|nr:PTS sugar transporter subunit IIA [Candidatus Didemnitutus sp.]
MALRLSELLEPDRISLSLRAGDREGCLQETAALLESHPHMADFSEFRRELLERLRLDTTSLGNSVALPHARTRGVRQIILAAGICPAGIDYDGGPPPVKMIFVVGTPPDRPGDYLGLVGSLCRVVKDASSRDLLLAAHSPEQFIATVQALEQRILGPRLR